MTWPSELPHLPLQPVSCLLCASVYWNICCVRTHRAEWPSIHCHTVCPLSEIAICFRCYFLCEICLLTGPHLRLVNFDFSEHSLPILKFLVGRERSQHWPMIFTWPVRTACLWNLIPCGPWTFSHDHVHSGRRLVAADVLRDLVVVLLSSCRLDQVTPSPRVSWRVYHAAFCFCSAVLRILKFSCSFPPYLPCDFKNCLYQPEFLVVNKTKSGQSKQKWRDRQATRSSQNGQGGWRAGPARRAGTRETTLRTMPNPVTETETASTFTSYAMPQLVPHHHPTGILLWHTPVTHTWRWGDC